MAVTVKSRAKAYAVAIARRKAAHGDATATPRVTPSLLALARINLQRELRRKLKANAVADLTQARKNPAHVTGPGANRAVH